MGQCLPKPSPIPIKNDSAVDNVTNSVTNDITRKDVEDIEKEITEYKPSKELQEIGDKLNGLKLPNITNFVIKPEYDSFLHGCNFLYTYNSLVADIIASKLLYDSFKFREKSDEDYKDSPYKYFVNKRKEFAKDKPKYIEMAKEELKDYEKRINDLTKRLEEITTKEPFLSTRISISKTEAAVLKSILIKISFIAVVYGIYNRFF